MFKLNFLSRPFVCSTTPTYIKNRIHTREKTLLFIKLVFGLTYRNLTCKVIDGAALYVLIKSYQ